MGCQHAPLPDLRNAACRARRAASGRRLTLLTRSSVDARQETLNVRYRSVQLLDSVAHLVPHQLILVNLVLEVLEDLGVEETGGGDPAHACVVVHD